MRWTFRVSPRVFTIVTTLRTFTIEARDLPTAIESAARIIIACIEDVKEVRE